MNESTKRSFAMAVGGALVALSASVAAGETVGKSSAMKLSDADLDRITAGSGAISVVMIFNPGKGPGEFKVNRNSSHGTCINCFEVLDVPRTSGFEVVQLPSGERITHIIRQLPFPLPF
jgi:hypothetical protein